MKQAVPSLAELELAKRLNADKEKVSELQKKLKDLKERQAYQRLKVRKTTQLVSEDITSTLSVCFSRYPILIFTIDVLFQMNEYMSEEKKKDVQFSPKQQDAIRTSIAQM